jgi:hypothetical protein
VVRARARAKSPSVAGAAREVVATPAVKIQSLMRGLVAAVESARGGAGHNDVIWRITRFFVCELFKRPIFFIFGGNCILHPPGGQSPRAHLIWAIN